MSVPPPPPRGVSGTLALDAGATSRGPRRPSAGWPVSVLRDRVCPAWVCVVVACAPACTFDFDPARFGGGASVCEPGEECPLAPPCVGAACVPQEDASVGGVHRPGHVEPATPDGWTPGADTDPSGEDGGVRRPVDSDDRTDRSRCVPGESVCPPGQPASRRVCVGGQWTEETCPPGHGCDAGVCVPLFCVPGQVRCAGLHATESCALDGGGFEAPQPCAPDHLCLEGACLSKFSCQPNTAGCNGDTQYVCRGQGDGFDAVDCAPGVCEAGKCQPFGACGEVGAKVCWPSDASRIFHCTDGAELLASEGCEVWERCHQGACVSAACRVPGVRRCESRSRRVECTDALTWGAPGPNPSFWICSSGGCRESGSGEAGCVSNCFTTPPLPGMCSGLDQFVCSSNVGVGATETPAPCEDSSDSPQSMCLMNSVGSTQCGRGLISVQRPQGGAGPDRILLRLAPDSGASWSEPLEIATALRVDDYGFWSQRGVLVFSGLTSEEPTEQLWAVLSDGYTPELSVRPPRAVTWLTGRASGPFALGGRTDFASLLFALEGPSGARVVMHRQFRGGAGQKVTPDGWELVQIRHQRAGEFWLSRAATGDGPATLYRWSSDAPHELTPLPDVPTGFTGEFDRRATNAGAVLTAVVTEEEGLRTLWLRRGGEPGFVPVAESPTLRAPRIDAALQSVYFSRYSDESTGFDIFRVHAIDGDSWSIEKPVLQHPHDDLLPLPIP